MELLIGFVIGGLTVGGVGYLCFRLGWRSRDSLGTAQGETSVPVTDTADYSKPVILDAGEFGEELKP